MGEHFLEIHEAQVFCKSPLILGTPFGCLPTKQWLQFHGHGLPRQSETFQLEMVWGPTHLRDLQPRICQVCGIFSEMEFPKMRGISLDTKYKGSYCKDTHGKDL